MLISALCDYYDNLSENGKVIPDGFSELYVSYMISLTPKGEIDSIIDLRETFQNGKSKKLVPRKIEILKRIETTTIRSNIIEHRGLYIFGLNYDKKGKRLTPYDEKNAAEKKHRAFVETNLDFVKDIDSPVVNAFRLFLNSWDPEKEKDNPLMSALGENVSKSNFIFCLSGNLESPLHKDESVLKKWKSTLKEDFSATEDVIIRQCPVLGEEYPVADLHDKIVGVKGGQASGTKLVCFNNKSENSYGKTQSYNSNISVVAMRKYTEALNYLLSSRCNHEFIDETTVVYWAQNGSQESDDLMSMLLFSDNSEEKLDDEMLNSLLKDCRNGVVTEEKLSNIERIDPETTYYFVGFKPNSSRISMKFIFRKSFGDFLLNSARHQSDLKIVGLDKAVSLWRIKEELISSKSKNENIDPALTSKLFEAILNNTIYPDELLYKIIQRVKIESNINSVRAGVIKACVNRHSRTKSIKEELTMSLDKSNENQAYLCGRLFAVLEQIQQKSSNYSLNRTIKDTYFSSAAARPASIFPKIMKLSQYHLSKLNNPKYFRDDIAEITEKLKNEFPVTLSLEEQGKFMIGYYHQINNKTKKVEE